MANELLPPEPAPAPTPEPLADAPHTCKFCECSLAKNGDVMRMSVVAKRYRDAADKLEAAEQRIADLDGKLATAIRERDAAIAGRGEPEPARGFLFNH